MSKRLRSISQQPPASHDCDPHNNGNRRAQTRGARQLACGTPSGERTVNKPVKPEHIESRQQYQTYFGPKNGIDAQRLRIGEK